MKQTINFKTYKRAFSLSLCVCGWNVKRDSPFYYSSDQLVWEMTCYPLAHIEVKWHHHQNPFSFSKIKKKPFWLHLDCCDNECISNETATIWEPPKHNTQKIDWWLMNFLFCVPFCKCSLLWYPSSCIRSIFNGSLGLRHCLCVKGSWLNVQTQKLWEVASFFFPELFGFLSII